MPSLVDLRAHAREIFFAGLSAADPLEAINRAVQREGDRLHIRERFYDLNRFQRIYVTGCGKAAGGPISSSYPRMNSPGLIGAPIALP